MQWLRKSSMEYVGDWNGVRLEYFVLYEPNWKSGTFGPWKLEAAEPGDRILLADGYDPQALMTLAEDMQKLIDAHARIRKSSVHRSTHG